MPLHLYKCIIGRKKGIVGILAESVTYYTKKFGCRGERSICSGIDYLLKQEGKRSPFGFAAYSISQLKEPLSTMKGELRKIKGVGRTTEVIIREILETGSSSYYEKMLNG